jgi:PAS domain S-box-containing protein
MAVMSWARGVSSTVVGLSTLALFGGIADTAPQFALGFLLAGLAVWGLTSEHTRWQRLGRLSGLGTGLIATGAASGLGLAMWGAPQPTEQDSILTAWGLLLASLALSLAPAKHAVLLRIFDLTAVVTLLAGILGTLCFFCVWPGERMLVPIALSSSLGFLGLGVGIAWLHPERSWLRSVRGQCPGGVLLRRLLPAAVLLLVLIELLRRDSELHDWFPGFGSAPFLLAELAGVTVFIMLSARSVRLAAEQADAARKALDDETREHASLLTERELRFRLLAETAPQIVWTAQPDGALDYLSPAWARFTGESEAHAQGWLWDKYIHREDLGRLLQCWRSAIARGVPYEMEYRARSHDGSFRWFLSRASPSRDSAQRIVRWYGADTEIHELREAREALILSEQRFRVALQDREFFVFTQDAELRYTWLHNPAFLGLAIGKNEHESLELSEDAERISQIKRGVLASGEPFSGHICLRQGGEQTFYELRVNPLRDSAGRIHGLAGAAYDITRSKRSDEALREAQKFQSIAQLAAGVAHDFNNILTAVVGNTSIALAGLPAETPERVAGLLQEVIDSGQHAAVLTRQLLAYAGKGRFQVEPTDVRRITDDLLSSFRAGLPANVRLGCELPAKLPLVQADASQLQELVRNLLTNAVEAVGAGPGSVSLSVRVVRLGGEAARGFDVQQARDDRLAPYVQIEVQDDGPGMDPETLRRAFEPFFSTKFVGRGLGLAAAQGTARAHGGGIVAQSEAGCGTRVVVTLPCLRDTLELPAALAPELIAPPATEGAGVLFVDDERNLREISRLTLGEAGYQVWLAKNGAEALEIVRANRDAIDVIVLDMTMPVMGGAEAARELRNEHFTIPIVASSGYSEVETLERFGGASPLFLPKPYRPADLLAAVASALALAQSQGARANDSHAPRGESAPLG